MINTLLITGCTSGLGYALASKLAQLDCIVYAVGRQQNPLDQLAKISRNIRPIMADIATTEGRLAVSQQVGSQKSLSLIHNAAIARPCQFESMSEAFLREHIETNFLAPLFITKQLLPSLTTGQRILNITSGAANLALPGLMPYCSSKAAMQIATQCLNLEFNSRGIHCANLNPGVMDTEMEKKFRDASEQALPQRQFYINLEKEKKLIDPAIVAEFIAWVLFKTEDAVFSKSLWNIYDKDHHPHWLPKDKAVPRY